MSFKQKLEKIVKKNNSLLCVGLDTDLEKIPKKLARNNDPIFEYNKKIIDATNDLVCSYKPNIAFYEAYGIEGLKSLKKTIDYLKSNFKDIPIILDAKRGDVPNTAKMYAKAVFYYWKADAVTVNPILGLDTIKPFLEYKDRLIILLIKTSNTDAKMFQDIKADSKPYYLNVAQIVKRWNFDNIGIFIGATYPKTLEELRTLFPTSIFLSAGLGAQSADIKKAVKAGIDENKSSIIFNASRSIIYAKDPRQEARKLRDEINKYRW